MGGFVITDQERKPVQVLVLHSSHLNDNYFEALLLTIIKVDDNIKADLKIIVTRCLEASIAADSVSSKPRSHFGFTNDDVIDGMTAILVMAILKRVPESELLQVVLSHEEVIRLLVGYMATEGAKIAFPVIMEKYKDEITEDATWEMLEIMLRDRLRTRLRERLPEKLRGVQKTLEKDIQGRSKQDSLAKTFALVQTTWFVTQCITRRAQHLPLTEIELMACAYAALNAAIYFFWWHKPFRVDYPIMLHSEIPPTVWEVQEMPNTSTLRHILGAWLGGNIYHGDNFCGKSQVPTFHSGSLYNIQWQGALDAVGNVVAEVLTTAIFGGIHFFAWNYQFPTRVELWLWRISALMIVTIPLFFLISTFKLQGLGLTIYLYTIVSLYLIARLTILILSITSLRKLTLGSLFNVDWLTFIPHID
ncbi:hypothetical protein Clacol_000989 [Clathrus columnatus]|uniref:Uncharacterized protein n=1 Tax=Clathrus columnatus TaxID=1419009 RepID=A0AAV5A2D4_9AGAM|nr:hypothetical protein Clacol_000989 [Clathrus columnatus]